MTEQQRGPESEQWRGMTPEDRGLTAPMLDDVFDALADWRRRATCQYLADCTEDGIDVDRLAAVVAERGRESGVAEGTAVEEVRVELVETHLPMLDRMGVLDYDERSEAVRYWGIPTVEKWADHADAVSRRNDF